MSKKNRQNINSNLNNIQQVSMQGISKLGKKIIFSGILVLIAGFYILTKTDSYGQNWASMLSPFLILGGYVIIGIGIIYPDKIEQSPSKPF